MSEPQSKLYLVRLSLAIASAAAMIGRRTLDFALGAIGAVITIPMIFLLGLIMWILELLGILSGDYYPRHVPEEPDAVGSHPKNRIRTLPKRARITET